MKHKRGKRSYYQIIKRNNIGAKNNKNTQNCNSALFHHYSETEVPLARQTCITLIRSFSVEQIDSQSAKDYPYHKYAFWSVLHENQIILYKTMSPCYRNISNPRNKLESLYPKVNQ